MAAKRGNPQGNMVRRTPQLKLKEAYKGVKDIVGTKAGKEKWEDSEILAHVSVSMKDMTHAEMNEECKIFLHGIAHEMTPRSALSALILTWNMRTGDSIETRMFPTEDAGEGPNDVNADTYLVNGAVYTDTETTAMFNGVRQMTARRASSFLAASTLKLFAKPGSSWIKGWENSHYQKRYKDFNKEEFPFSAMTVVEPNIHKMAELYQTEKIFKGTLGRILYALAEAEDKRQTEMLFDQHLTCTGLHLIPQFITAKSSLGATSEQMLSALDYEQNGATLRELARLINESLSVEESVDNRGTWRFSRLFDESAFKYLQSKYAQDTLCVLAQINTMCTASTSLSNPMNIAVIRQMSATRKKTLRGVARLIYHYFMVSSRAKTNEFFDVDQFGGDEDSEDEEEEEDAEVEA